MTAKEQIEEMEKQLLSAIKANNSSALEELLHDDLLFNLQDGKTITKQMDLEVYVSGNINVNEIITQNQSIQVIGDNAVVTKIVQLRGLYFNQAFEGLYKYIRVWKLFEGKWQVIAGACHVLP